MTHLTDQQGEVAKEYRYDAFGGLFAGQAGIYNASGLTGKSYDPKTGLMDYGARWYDPLAGRFTQQDTVMGALTNPLSLNRYAYALNNPLRWIDPTGHSVQDPSCDFTTSCQDGSIVRYEYGTWWKSSRVREPLETFYSESGDTRTERTTINSEWGHFLYVYVDDVIDWDQSHTVYETFTQTIDAIYERNYDGVYAFKDVVVSGSLGPVPDPDDDPPPPTPEEIRQEADAKIEAETGQAPYSSWDAYIEAQNQAASKWWDSVVNSEPFKVTMSGLEAVGGVAEAAAGVAICTTVVLCAVGGAMFVDGAAHTGSGVGDAYSLTLGDESDYGQHNFLKNAAKEISPEYGETAYNVASLGLNLAGGVAASRQVISAMTAPATAEDLLALGSYKYGYATTSAEPAVAETEETITLYRGTRTTKEVEFFEETNIVMSDAARQGYYSSGSVDEAIAYSQQVHQEAIDFWGSEQAYVQAHGEFGTELARETGLDRTLMSWTTDPGVASRFAGDEGVVFMTEVPVSQVIFQSIEDAGESEVLIRHAVQATIWE